MCVCENDLPERLLLPRLGQPPSEGLERRAHLDCLVRCLHECLYLLVAQGSQRRLLWLVYWWPLLHQLDLPRSDSLILLLEVLLLGDLLLHCQIALRHAISWELILELLLHRIQLCVEGVVHSRVETRHHLLVYSLVLAWRIVSLSSSHEYLVLLHNLRLLLLDHGVNERWLVVEIDAVL